MLKQLLGLVAVAFLVLSATPAEAGSRRCRIDDVHVSINANGQLVVFGHVSGVVDANACVEVRVTDCRFRPTVFLDVDVDIDAEGFFYACEPIDLEALADVRARLDVKLELRDGRGRCCHWLRDIVDLSADLSLLLRLRGILDLRSSLGLGLRLGR